MTFAKMGPEEGDLPTVVDMLVFFLQMLYVGMCNFGETCELEEG